MAKKENEDYFICVCLCKTLIEGVPTRDIEERFVLLIAESEEEAKAKAEALKETATFVYKNSDGQTVKDFVFEIVEVGYTVHNSFTDGSEIYCRFFNSNRLEHYRASRAPSKPRQRRGG